MTTPSYLSNGSFEGPVQVVWDNTSLVLAKQCYRRYYYAMILGYAPKGSSADLDYGIAFHKAMETYYRHLYYSNDHDFSVGLALKAALTTPFTPREGDTYKTKDTLARSVVWYCENYRDEEFSTLVIDSSPAVELSYKLPVGQDPEVWLSGHLDIVGIFMGELYIRDYKTTKRSIQSDYYWQDYTPNNQVSQYTYAGQHILHEPVKGLLIDAVQVQVNATLFARRPIRRTQRQLDEWFEGAVAKIDEVQCMQQAEELSEDFWPMNDTACKSGGFICPFLEVCSADPRMRETILKGNYEQKIWDPSQNR